MTLKGNLRKATNSLFHCEMIAKLEMTQITAQQSTKTRKLMEATLNNRTTTLEQTADGATGRSRWGHSCAIKEEQ